MVAMLGARFVQEICLGSECVYNHVPTAVLEPQPPYEDVSTAELKTLLQGHKVQVLLLTSTDTERKALHLRMAPLAGRKGLVEGAIHRVTYRLGRLGRYPVAHVESTAGSQARHGAALTIHDALNELEPKVVLSVGIAFGLDPKKQRLGDVIVAEAVIPYELQRVDMKVIHRAQPILCGSLLSERFRTRRADWRFACGEEFVNVFQGVMLSGEKLVDSKEFLGRLIEAFPQAVAGEMEGAGLYAATARQGVEVLLVKALCDWGNGSKTDRVQAFAAKAAVSLVEHVLNKKDVLAPLIVDDVEREPRAEPPPANGPAVQQPPTSIITDLLSIFEPGEERHSWSVADDLVAFYLYRFSAALLPFDLDTIAERRGIKPGSMKMRISNFKALAGKGKLGNIAKQSKEVFERYKDTAEPELRNLAFPELVR